MISLTSDQRELIAQSYKEMDAEAMAQQFYTNLFERFPDVKALFHNTTLEKQAGMFADALRVTVKATTEQDETGLEQYVSALGVRHEGRYHVNENDHIMFRRVLLETIAEHLKDSWTNAHHEAWYQALKQISMIMHG